MYKGMIRYFLILAILLCLWSIVSGYLLFVLCILFFLLPFFSFLISFRDMKKALISCHINAYIKERGDDFEITFQRESSLFGCGPIYIQYALYDYQHQEITTKTILIDNESYQETIKQLHTGCYVLQIKKCYFFDYTQCFFIKRDIDFKQELYVFPKQLDTQFQLKELLGKGQDEIVYSTTKPGDDYTEIYDLHHFRQDDSFQHIHWKASLKKNQWLVKEGSLPLSKHILLILGEYSDPNLDYFYSLCCDLLKQHIVYDVLYLESSDQSQVMTIYQEENLRECLQILLKLPHHITDYQQLISTDAYVIIDQGIEVIHK